MYAFDVEIVLVHFNMLFNQYIELHTLHIENPF